MAINLASRYPGKTAGANEDYPTGQARNVTVPGDGTGTPWEAALVNDDQGFKQALLKEANMTPTGNPDTALNSQYLEAMQKLFVEQGALTAILGPTGSISIPVLFSGQPKFFQLKWGTVDYDYQPGRVQVDIVFSSAFPAACYGVFTQRKQSRDSFYGDGGAMLLSQSRTGFSVSLQDFSDNIRDLRGFGWFAIGA